MEAHGCREFPPTAAAGASCASRSRPRCSTASCPRFAAQLALAGAGRAAGYARHGRPRDDLPARAHALRRRRARRARPAAADLARGARRRRHATALDDLYAQLIWVPDGENEPLSEWARRYRDIIGPPDPPTAATAARATARAATAAAVRHPGRERRRRRPPDVGSLREALERACEQARDGQLEQLDEDADLAAHARAGGRRRPGGRRAQGRRHRRADRPHARPRRRPPAVPRRGPRGQAARPAPAARPHARTAAHRQAHARRALRRPRLRARPLRARHRAPGELAPVDDHARDHRAARGAARAARRRHLGLDAAHEYALGPIVWIVTTAFRAIGGKVATVLFGNAAALLSDGTEPMANVPAIRVGGGTAFAGDAIVDRRRPPRDGEPPPPARRLRRLGRRLVRHRGRRAARSAGSPSSASPRSTSRSAPSRCRSKPAASACSPTPPTASTLIAQHTVDALSAARRPRAAA